MSFQSSPVRRIDGAAVGHTRSSHEGKSNGRAGHGYTLLELSAAESTQNRSFTPHESVSLVTAATRDVINDTRTAQSEFEWLKPWRSPQDCREGGLALLYSMTEILDNVRRARQSSVNELYVQQSNSETHASYPCAHRCSHSGQSDRGDSIPTSSLDGSLRLSIRNGKKHSARNSALHYGDGSGSVGGEATLLDYMLSGPGGSHRASHMWLDDDAARSLPQMPGPTLAGVTQGSGRSSVLRGAPFERPRFSSRSSSCSGQQKTNIQQGSSCSLPLEKESPYVAGGAPVAAAASALNSDKLGMVSLPVNGEVSTSPPPPPSGFSSKDEEVLPRVLSTMTSPHEHDRPRADLVPQAAPPLLLASARDGEACIAAAPPKVPSIPHFRQLKSEQERLQQQQEHHPHARSEAAQHKQRAILHSDDDEDHKSNSSDDDNGSVPCDNSEQHRDSNRGPGGECEHTARPGSIHRILNRSVEDAADVDDESGDALMAPPAIGGSGVRDSEQDAMEESELEEGEVEDDLMSETNFGEGGHLACVPGDTLHQRYALLKPLGVGRSSRVWLAVDLEQCSLARRYLIREFGEREVRHLFKPAERPLFVAIKVFRCASMYTECALYEAKLSTFVEESVRQRQRPGHHPIAPGQTPSASHSTSFLSPIATPPNLNAPIRTVARHVVADSASLRMEYEGKERVATSKLSKAPGIGRALSSAGSPPSLPSTPRGARSWRTHGSDPENSVPTSLVARAFSERLTKFRDAFTVNGAFGIHQCLVMDVLGAGVDKAINETHLRGFPSAVARAIMRSSLQGLSLLAACHLIHTDLKPENLLFTELEADVADEMKTYQCSQLHTSPHSSLWSSFTHRREHVLDYASRAASEIRSTTLLATETTLPAGTTAFASPKHHIENKEPQGSLDDTVGLGDCRREMHYHSEEGRDSASLRLSPPCATTLETVDQQHNTQAALVTSAGEDVISHANHHSNGGNDALLSQLASPHPCSIPTLQPRDARWSHARSHRRPAYEVRVSDYGLSFITPPCLRLGVRALSNYAAAAGTTEDALLSLDPLEQLQWLHEKQQAWAMTEYASGGGFAADEAPYRTSASDSVLPAVDIGMADDLIEADELRVLRDRANLGEACKEVGKEGPHSSAGVCVGRDLAMGLVSVTEIGEIAGSPHLPNWQKQSGATPATLSIPCGAKTIAHRGSGMSHVAHDSDVLDGTLQAPPPATLQTASYHTPVSHSLTPLASITAAAIGGSGGDASELLPANLRRPCEMVSHEKESLPTSSPASTAAYDRLGRAPDTVTVPAVELTGKNSVDELTPFSLMLPSSEAAFAGGSVASAFSRGEPKVIPPSPFASRAVSAAILSRDVDAATALRQLECDIVRNQNYGRGTAIQSREYRAPEVLLGNFFLPSCDIWSMGCVAYELVTGRFLLDSISDREKTAKAWASSHQHQHHQNGCSGHSSDPAHESSSEDTQSHDSSNENDRSAPATWDGRCFYLQDVEQDLDVFHLKAMMRLLGPPPLSLVLQHPRGVFADVFYDDDGYFRFWEAGEAEEAGIPLADPFRQEEQRYRAQREAARRSDDSARLGREAKENGTPLRNPLDTSNYPILTPGWRKVQSLLLDKFNSHEEAKDFERFLLKCLQWDPAQRATAAELLADDWIVKYSGLTALAAESDLDEAVREEEIN